MIPSASYLLQAGAEPHVAEVVGQERARAVGRVAGEQQPAEERHVSLRLHAAVQLQRSGQHEQLQRLQQTQLLFPPLEQALAQTLPLGHRGTVHRCLPLGGGQVHVRR